MFTKEIVAGLFFSVITIGIFEGGFIANAQNS